MELTKENVGIIGQGFVGTAIREKFKVEYNVFTYDKYKASDSRIYNGDLISDNECSILDIVKECKIAFVCVPTPMFQDGKCDISIVDSVINELNEECIKLNSKLTVIIKSTVPPGTTANLNSKYSNVGIVFSPEFLTEANANEDFKNQTRIVLGVDWIEYVEPVGKLFEKVFPEANLIYVNSIEAEMTKYFTNLFLATKVSFFNDMYKLCKRLNRSESTNVDINYNNVIEATLHDERIGKTHTMVPGPDGDYGYGGHCFPGHYEVNAISGPIDLSSMYENMICGAGYSILSTNSSVDNIEYKEVLEVTRNKFTGDLLKFTLDNGSVIECTPEHLFPISRNGELILTKACNIVDTDEFHIESEIHNKKTLTSSANSILR